MWEKVMPDILQHMFHFEVIVHKIIQILEERAVFRHCEPAKQSSVFNTQLILDHHSSLAMTSKKIPRKLFTLTGDFAVTILYKYLQHNTTPWGESMMPRCGNLWREHIWILFMIMVLSTLIFLPMKIDNRKKFSNIWITCLKLWEKTWYPDFRILCECLDRSHIICIRMGIMKILGYSFCLIGWSSYICWVPVDLQVRNDCEYLLDTFKCSLLNLIGTQWVII